MSIKISIFKNLKAIPDGKNEKATESSKAVSPETVDITSIDNLIEVITSHAWSPSVFNGSRKSESFVSSDFMCMDVDSGLTIEDAETRCQKEGLFYVIIPSPSFTEEKHKYRIIFPLVRTIRDIPTFEATWLYVFSLFPESDILCKDVARFYFGSTLKAGGWKEGKLLVPVKHETTNRNDRGDYSRQLVKVEGYDDLSPIEKLYGKVPEFLPKKVDFFLKNCKNGLEGKWVLSLNDCVFTLSLQGVNEETIVDVIESIAPNPLDKRDIRTIEIALKDAEHYRQT